MNKETHQVLDCGNLNITKTAILSKNTEVLKTISDF